MNQPRPYDSIHNDEIVSFGVSFSGVREDTDNHLVLAMGFGEVRWNCSLPNEMPKVIRMQMDCRSSERSDKASRRGAFTGAW
jgi:hypothetical protein